MSVKSQGSYTDQPKLVLFLDLSFVALTVLAISGALIYVTFLESTIQNAYPVLIVAYFMILTLYFRVKVIESPDDYEKLKRLFRLWLFIGIVGFAFGMFIILTFPV